REKDEAAVGCFSKTALMQAAAKGERDKPWLMRQASAQSVTLNLPRLGYKAGGEDDKLFASLKELMDKAARAHIQKKDFLEKLLSYAEQGPLAVLAMNADGYPFFRMNRAHYIIGLVGLNELMQIHRGSQLHESEAAVAFGLKLVAFLRQEALRLTTETGMTFVLEQSPAETTAYRFARLDLKYYSPAAGRFVRGDIADGSIYYTNSTHLNTAADVSPLRRAIEEGRFHPYLEGEVITHLQLDIAHPDREILAAFVRDVFEQSRCRQMDLMPEFTACLSCGKTAPGLKDHCGFCDSTDVEGIARLTKYYSKTSGWNKGKLAELKNRKAGNFQDRI
ncbi:MAG: anaerobic ribonucleoside-triphosphate reductase, partial [Smithellaceae bacterium]